MNSNETFFNNKYSVICKKDYNIEGFDFYTEDLQKVYFDIRKKELKEDRLYRGHIIFNDLDIKINKILLDNLVKDNILTPKNFFAYDILHDGVDSVCNIDTKVVFCSSWVLPFYAFNFRTNNTLYGDIFARRLEMYKLQPLKDLI